jgi:peptidyl-prolyl cis-trans isomerase D
MLDLLRNNTRSFIIYLLFAIIIVVFVFTFNTITPGQACGGEGPQGLVSELATVGDEIIDNNMLNVAVQMNVTPPSPGADDPRAFQRNFTYKGSRFLRLGLGSPYPDFGQQPDRVSPIAVEKAMGDLVENFLVAQEARRSDLAVSDRELTDRLINETWYDADTGEFRKTDYDNFVRYQVGTTPTRFEGFVRRELLREKLITLITSGVTASTGEVTFHHRAENERVDLAYVKVDDKTAAKLVPASEADVTGWLAANQEAVNKYYEDNSSEFSKEERVVVRGLQIKAPNRALIGLEKDEKAKASMATQREEARKRADDTLAKANVTPGDPETGAVTMTEADFRALVEASSDHSGTKSQGGLFEKPRDRAGMGRWPFGEGAADAVFPLTAGQISKVVEVDSGYWIFRIESKLAAESRSLEDARLSIAENLYRAEKGPAFRKTLAEAIHAAAKKDASRPLAEVVVEINGTYGITEDSDGLEVNQTSPFARLRPGAFGASATVGTVPGLGDIEGLAAAAFRASKENPLLDPIFEVPERGHLVVAQFTSREDAGEMDDDTRTAITDRIVREKQKSFYRGWYEARLQEALDSGDVALHDSWKGLLQASIDVYRQAGGELAPPAVAQPAVIAPATK